MRVRKNKRQHKKFEYKRVLFNLGEFDDAITKKGLEGWEMVNFQYETNCYILMFKREIL